MKVFTPGSLTFPNDAGLIPYTKIQNQNEIENPPIEQQLISTNLQEGCLCSDSSTLDYPEDN